jgi:putative ABC transport system permease protein
VVSPQQENSGLGFPATIAEDVKALKIGAALGIAVSLLSIEENDEYAAKGVMAVVPADAAAVFNITFAEGSFAALDSSSILYSVDKAARDGLSVGSVVKVKMLDGTERQLTVSGLFSDDVFGNLIVDRSLFDGQAIPLADRWVFVKSDGGVSTESTEALRALIDTYPTAKVQSRDQYIDEQSKAIDGFLNFIYALLGMSVFIASVGIVITLWLAVWERRRELGLLRAVGMTRRQVRSSVLWESMVTGIVGVLMGLVIGVVLGWIIVSAFADDGLSVFSLPASTIVVVSIMALVLAALAAFLPARKASKADILEAIATT